MNYSLQQLQALAASVGFPDPNLAAAVAMAESGGNACAQGDPNIGAGGYQCGGPNGTSTSFGLWQVNTTFNPQYDAASLLGGPYNARAAYAISNGGANWNPWTTYRTGAFKRWYTPPPVTVPASGGGSGAAVLVAIAVAATLGGAGYAAYRELRR